MNNLLTFGLRLQLVVILVLLPFSAEARWRGHRATSGNKIVAALAITLTAFWGINKIGQPARPSTQLAVSTYNINYSRSAKNDCGWNARRQRVFDVVSNLNSDILAIQEVVDKGDVASEVSYDDVKTFLEKDHFVFEAPFKGDRTELRQFLFTAMKKDTFANAKLDSRKYDVRDFILETKETGVLGTVQATAIARESHSILVFNHHFPMRKNARFATAKALNLIADKARTDLFPGVKLRDIKIVHLGDFNSFPDDEGSEQMGRITLDNELEDIGVNATYSNPEILVNGMDATGLARFTFAAFPHDLDRAARSGLTLGKVPGHLDHILVSRNMRARSVRVGNLDQKKILYHFTADSLKGINDYAIFPSDHLPLTAELEF